MERKSVSLGTPPLAPADDLVEQLTVLEARAVAAEDELAQVRHEHAARVHEMEEKLRGLDPWIQNLRAEFQAVTDERDALRAHLATATGSLDDGARAEISALRAERDAAQADVAALAVQLEGETTDLDRRWTRRVEALEAAREEAVARCAAADRAAAESRGGAEEARHLRHELSASSTTISAHKAVARAAQEAAATLKERVAELEAAQIKSATQHDKQTRALERLEEKMASRAADLKSARANANELEEQLSVVRARAAKLEEQAVAMKGDAAEAAVAREQAEEARREIEKLRAETAEAKQALARVDEESAFARRSAESVRHELESVTKRGEAARIEADRLRTDLEQARERLVSAEELVAEAAAESETTATRLGLLEAEHRAAVDRLTDLEEELSVARVRLETADAVEADARELEKLRSEVDCGRSAIATLQSANDALQEEVDALRKTAGEQAAAAANSRESQVEAIRMRAEAEMTTLRARIEKGEALLSEVHGKLAGLTEVRDEEMRRIRLGVCTALGEGMQRLIDGMEQVLGPDMALPGTSAEVRRPVEELRWDALLAELEGLRTEVEHFREVDPEAVAEAEITASIQIDVLPGVDVPTMRDPSSADGETTGPVPD